MWKRLRSWVRRSPSAVGLGLAVLNLTSAAVLFLGLLNVPLLMSVLLATTVTNAFLVKALRNRLRTSFSDVEYCQITIPPMIAVLASSLFLVDITGQYIPIWITLPVITASLYLCWSEVSKRKNNAESTSINDAKEEATPLDTALNIVAEHNASSSSDYTALFGAIETEEVVVETQVQMKGTV